jgi:hypothetical protein
MSLEKFHALSIGVKRDDDAPAMSVTTTDAQRLASELQRFCNFKKENIAILVEESTEKSDILLGLDNLIQKTTIEKADFVIVYFSGHGCKKGSSYYLINRDAEVKDLENTAIKGQDFVEKLNQINTEKLLVLLDCCHSGGINTDGVTSIDIPFDKSALLDNGQNRAIITACPSDEVAWTASPLSVFTYALIKGLGGYYFGESDKQVTLFDLAMFIREETFIRSNRQQRPQLEVLNNERISNFVIVDYSKNALPSPVPFYNEPFYLYDGNLNKVKALDMKENFVDEDYRKEYGWLKNAVINSTLTAGRDIHIGGKYGFDSDDVVKIIEAVKSDSKENNINIPTDKTQLKEFKEKLMQILADKAFQGIPEVLREIEDSNYKYTPFKLSSYRNNYAQAVNNKDDIVSQVEGFIDSLKLKL